MIPQYLIGNNSEEERYYGVTIGIVTNNKDEDGLGRVKVKFPLLSETDESYWARVLSPMAGKERGLYCLPEIEDEVLVAFENGMIDCPYILGGLWNGVDKPPESNQQGVNRRLIKSRSGHTIVLDDTEGSEHIQIVDGSGDNSITITMKDNSISIEAKGDIILKASGEVNISGSNKVSINNGSQGAARQNDPVEVMIPSGTFITQVSGGGGAPAVGVLNPAPVTVNGKIKTASGTVKIGD